MDFANLTSQIIMWHSRAESEILVQGAESHFDKLVKRNSNHIHTFIYTRACVYIYIYIHHFEEKLIIFINFNIHKLSTLQSIYTPPPKKNQYYNFFECHHSQTLNLICFVFSFLFFLFNILSLIQTLTNNFKLNNNNNEKLSPKE